MYVNENPHPCGFGPSRTAPDRASLISLRSSHTYKPIEIVEIYEQSSIHNELNLAQTAHEVPDA
jgi:hypothetical protein